MSPRLQNRTASVTLVALCFTCVLAIALSSYLALYQRSYDFSTRGLLDNKARQLAQTGLEEALWALNQNVWTDSGPSSDTAWTVTGADRTVTLTYGSLGQGATGRVALTVASFASTGPTWPVITSTATVAMDDGRIFTKTLRATTGPAPLFGNAIASAHSYVSFTSQGTVDSWNSDPDGDSTTAMVPYSFTAGNAANYAAVIASDDAAATSISLAQATVYGYLATTGKAVTYSTSGSPRARVQGPTTGAGVDVEPGRIGKSAFIPADTVFTVTPPPVNTGPVSLLTLLVNTLTIAPTNDEIYSAPTGFNMPTGVLNLGYTLYVDRAVRMVVNGNFSIGSGLLGDAKIVVRPPDGALQIFVTGDVTIGGGGIVNQTNEPRRVAIYSTSSVTTDSIVYSSSADFCGVIYSENKPIDIQANATFSGALLSGQYVRFSAGATNPVFHYDSALRQVRFSGIATPYIITLLTES
jgi:hypothetical protein